jgi:S1-C subfamily serine protease
MIAPSIFLILVVSGSLGYTMALAQPDSEEILISKIKPAVVYVQVKGEGVVRYPYFYYDSQKLTAWPQGVEKFAEEHVWYYWRGSGFIVTPDGYIITNAHVAAPSEESMKGDLEYWWAYLYVKDISKEKSLTQAQFDGLVTGLRSFITSHGKWTSVGATTHVWFGAVIPGEITVSKGYLADLRKAGEAAGWEKGVTRDVAIIKIEAKNLPTVKLADSDSVKVGEHIIAIGYPGIYTFQLEEEATLIPSVSTGIVSALKPVPAGFDAIQHDAATTFGSSGGPIFNSNGEVIGIHTFQGSGQTGERVTGFAIPINIAKQFLNEINVKPTSGELDAHWSRAIDLYYQQRYSDAINELNIVQQLKPGFYYADEFVQSSREAISRGEDIKGFEIGGLFVRDIYLYAAVGIVAIAVVSIVLVLGRGRGLRLSRPKPTAPVAVSFCSKCGAPRTAGDPFCVNCGNRYSD